MGHRASAIGPLALVIALAGCASALWPSPFEVSEEQFHARVKRIARAPVVVMPKLGVADSTKLRLEELIDGKLQKAGFVTLPSKDFAEIFGRRQREAGGLFDSRTGDLDEGKVKTVLAQTVDEVRGNFPLDAVLLPRVEVVKAPYKGVWARWHGVSEALAPGRIVVGGVNARGTVSALSLTVTIDGVDGARLYTHRCGIQVMEKLAPFGERLKAADAAKMFVPVPKEQLLADEERNRAAVEVVFGPMLRMSAAR